MNNKQPHSVVIAGKAFLSATALAAVFLFTAIPRLHAEDADRCQLRVRHAEHDLHEAIEHHGRHSRQADHERAATCTPRGSAAGESATGGGTNTSTAGTPNATGTSAITTATSWGTGEGRVAGADYRSPGS